MGYRVNYSVYKIKNHITNQYYIGVDSYYPKRLNQHQSKLKNNKHRNRHLQSSYNKYGAENFSFKLLKFCENRKEMLSEEVKYIKHFKSFKEGFNHTIGGEGSFGYKHSKESLLKMKGGDYSFTQTQEFKDKISKANKGKKKKPFQKVSKGLEIDNKKLYSLGKPNFKKKQDKQSYRLPNQKFSIENNKIRIEKIGWVNIKMERCIPTEWK